MSGDLFTLDKFLSLCKTQGVKYAADMFYKNDPKFFEKLDVGKHLSIKQIAALYRDSNYESPFLRVSLKSIKEAKGTFKKWADIQQVVRASKSSEFTKIWRKKLFEQASTFDQLEYSVYHCVTGFVHRADHLLKKEIAVAIKDMANKCRTLEQCFIALEYLEEKGREQVLRKAIKHIKDHDDWTKLYHYTLHNSAVQKIVIEKIASNLHTYEEWKNYVPGRQGIDEYKNLLTERALEELAKRAKEFGQCAFIVHKFHFFGLTEKHSVTATKLVDAMIGMAANDDFDKMVSIYDNAVTMEQQNYAMEKIREFPSQSFDEWERIVRWHNRTGQLAIFGRQMMMALAGKNRRLWKIIEDCSPYDEGVKKTVSRQLLQLA